MRNTQGKLIALEGCTGVGKSTQLERLQIQLTMEGYKSIVFSEREHEPFRTEVKKWRRSEEGEQDTYSLETVQAMAIARGLLHAETLAPMLQELDFVIMDRSYITSAVYQSVAGFSPEFTAKLQLEHGAILLDHAFILDCEPETSHYRASTRNAAEFTEGIGLERAGELVPNPVEEIESIRYKHELYRDIAGLNERYHLIDTDSRSVEEITAELMNYLRAHES